MSPAGRLPAEAGRAAALLLGRRAGTHVAGGGVVLDRERVAGLRRRLDRVLGRRRRAVDRHIGAEVLDLGRLIAVLVGLVVDEAGLHLRHDVARIGLRRRVLALRALPQERRQGDGGQDADDQDHDQELDQGEALLVLSALTQLVEHVGRTLQVRMWPYGSGWSWHWPGPGVPRDP